MLQAQSNLIVHQMSPHDITVTAPQAHPTGTSTSYSTLDEGVWQGYWWYPIAAILNQRKTVSCAG